MRFCGLLVLPCLHRYWKWPYGLIKQSRSSTRRHIYLIQTYQIYCIQIYICKRRQPESAKHRRIFMPIWFAYLTILPGSAAGASALNIYSIHGSYGLFSVNFADIPNCLPLLPQVEACGKPKGRFREWREGMKAERDPQIVSQAAHFTRTIYGLRKITLWLWLTVRHGIDGPNRNRWFTEPENGGSFHGYVSHNQMVYTYSKWWSSTSLLLTSCRLCSIFPASKLWVWGFLPENQHGFSTFRSPLSSPIKSAKKPKSRPLRCLGHKRNSSNQPIRYGYLWKILIFS